MTRQGTIKGEVESFGAIILCGGRSRRMGHPKEWIGMAGTPALTRLCQEVSKATGPVVLAARPGQELPDCGPVLIARDFVDGAGPLVGFISGWRSLPADCSKAFVCPGDHFLMVATFVHRLCSMLGGHPAVYAAHSGEVFPLLGVFRRESASVAEKLIEEDERRAQTLVERIGGVPIDAKLLRGVDPELRSLHNFNDAESLRLLERPAKED